MSQTMTQSQEAAPGVMWFTRGNTAVWRGTAEALIAAGRVHAYQLPGAPGNSLTMSSYRSDGTKVHRGDSRRPRPGDITIVAMKRKSGMLYEVRVRLPFRTAPESSAPEKSAPVLPPQETQDAIESVLEDLRKLDGSICKLSMVPAPAPRVTAFSLKLIREARTKLAATIVAADWEVA